MNIKIACIIGFKIKKETNIHTHPLSPYPTPALAHPLPWFLGKKDSLHHFHS